MVTFANNLVFLSPRDPVRPIALNFAWTERHCHACETPLSMYPSIYNTFQGLKTFFCVQEDELLWAADELLTEEGQTHPVVLSHHRANKTGFAQWPERYYGCEQWRIHIGKGGGGDRTPLPEWSLKSFFGNQFSQFVVNFLFHGLRKFSPITNLSPQYLCFCANKFSRSTPAGKCWSFTHSLMT